MIARDGWPLIIIGVVLTVVLLWGATRWDNLLLFIFSLLFALLTTFTAFFFRDPDRVVPLETNVLVAPADGRVVAIDTLPSHEYIGGKTIQVSIFLSIFDVHVNRAPVSAAVEHVVYHPGKFLPAYRDKASLENEQTEIGMITEHGQRLIVKQIAGLIARRVVCHLKPGDTVMTGQRFGMIRFGSRTDLLVPADSRIDIGLGDRVYGGRTIVGYLSGLGAESRPVESLEGDNAKL